MIGGMMRLTLIFLLAAAAGSWVAAAAPGEEEAAAAAGQKWLSLVDQEKYEESWNQADSSFREQVTLERWLASLKRFRQPLGPMLSRTASRVEFTKTLRGAPDADYCIIHFSAAFEKQSGVTERLTLVKVKQAEQGDAWIVTAYAIH
jgi:hypothetical protein